MPYNSIPGVGATYLDGAFKTYATSGQPRILILGTAASGLTYEIYQVTSVGAAEAEFGVESEMMKHVHEAAKQGADNIAVMRIGGHQGTISLVFTHLEINGVDTDDCTIEITPEYRDAEILDRYALILEPYDNDGDSSYDYCRYLVYDKADKRFVYDSEELECMNVGLVEVTITNTLPLLELNDKDDPDSADTLDDLTTSPGAGPTDFTNTAGTEWDCGPLHVDTSWTCDTTAVEVDTTATAHTTISHTDGEDGTSMSLVERYAALNTAYSVLDYRDADFIIPCSVYLDDLNVEDGDTPDYGSGCPTPGTADDVLGYVWQYVYRGKVYTYFSEDDDLYTSYATLAREGGTGAVFTAVDGGPAGENVTVHIQILAANAVTVTGNEIDISTNGAAVAWSTIKLIYDAVPAAVALAALTLTGGGGASITACASTPLALADAWLGPDDLTGDTVPTAVTTAWEGGNDTQLREVNFAHQLASFCHNASTGWKSMLGFISTKAPPGYDRITLADWVGTLPVYTALGSDTAVMSGDDGEGLLGNKFMAGEGGYRDPMLELGGATDGYAYGGLILTSGDSLPNDIPYGIDDDDEVLDDGGRPIDIGKYLFVNYDWPIQVNRYDGGTKYRGDLRGVLAGRFATLPENVEPIGDSGLLPGISFPPRLMYPQINELASIRFIGTRFDDRLGYVLVSCKTAAHPDSDYTRLSTIRCVNRCLNGIRNLARPYIGKAFTSLQLASLQQAIDQFLLDERTGQYNQGAIAQLSYSRNDRILGRLTVKIRMVPPFCIEAIDIEISLAAEESEL